MEQAGERQSSMKIVYLLSAVVFVTADWTQQYGNQGSTSYCDYKGEEYSWSYTTQPFVSQTSPSVNDDGVLFYPLRAYIVAINPNGTVQWKAGVAPNGDAYLTNTLYSKRYDIVIVGAAWDNLFQIVAVHAISGEISWTSLQKYLYHCTTLSISTKIDAVFGAGYDSGTFTAVRLSDGKSIWSERHIYQVGIFMQTKVGTFESDDGQVVEVAILPTDPFNGFDGKGTLFAYDVSKLYTWPFEKKSILWHTDLGFTAGALFAFTELHGGIMYGSNAGSSGGQGDIFIVSTQNGSVVSSGWGECDRGVEGTSGPVVDDKGYVYFRYEHCTHDYTVCVSLCACGWICVCVCVCVRSY